MELEQVVEDVAEALVAVDGCGVAFKAFRPGVGPYGEPRLLSAVAKHLNAFTPRMRDWFGPRERQTF